MKQKAKLKVSQRELWMMALLPAFLVIIVSMGLPDKSEEIAAAERRLDRVSSPEAVARQRQQLQELATQLEESRQTLDVLAAQEADLKERIQAAQSPVAGRTQSMAHALDMLTRRLAGHGIQVLAVTEVGGSGARRDWRVSVAATWQDVREALAETETFPVGMALATLQMAPERPTAGSTDDSVVALRRWELQVRDLGAG
jgi:exonuclease VII large subunit